MHTTMPNTPAPFALMIHQEYELRDWAKKFDATPEQIKEAVKRVGNRAADVEMDLKGSHATTNADQEARGERH